MRFHLPALIGRPTTAANSSCAYTQKVRRFAQMMVEAGHEVFLYGGGSHTGIGGVNYVDAYGAVEPVEFEPALWTEGNRRAAREILRRVEDGDVLGVIAGTCQRELADMLPMTRVVEYGIGYGGTFADFRVFESYAWMHAVYALQDGPNAHDADGRFFDAVIPNFFDPDDFPAGPGDGGYLLYVGRLTGRKGVDLAGEVAERAGLPLLVAGAGSEPPRYGELLGAVEPAQRAELMGNARAVLVPTFYLEPFGGVAVEAQLCGTPAITTDWGAFPETVRHGVTGFRCRTMGEFLYAVDAAPELDRAAIRERAVANYSLAAVAPRYERYFDRVAALDRDGFYDTERTSGLPLGA